MHRTWYTPLHSSWGRIRLIHINMGNEQGGSSDNSNQRGRI